ncbi:hypothetical protein LBMAG49_23930 [Planctomycetota bacterium]|nr:hypothetical protein LBMAG49_23930 [Planctomycetota bacterium]
MICSLHWQVRGTRDRCVGGDGPVGSARHSPAWNQRGCGHSEGSDSAQQSDSEDCFDANTEADYGHEWDAFVNDADAYFRLMTAASVAINFILRAMIFGVARSVWRSFFMLV